MWADSVFKSLELFSTFVSIAQAHVLPAGPFVREGLRLTFLLYKRAYILHLLHN